LIAFYSAKKLPANNLILLAILGSFNLILKKQNNQNIGVGVKRLREGIIFTGKNALNKP
jgi:hypothetical protein